MTSIPPPRRGDFMHMWIDICSLYVCGMNIFTLYIHISIHYFCIFIEMVLYCTYYLETCFSSLTILSLVSRFFFFSVRFYTIFIWIQQIAGEGNGTPLQYFFLENPMDGGAWWAAVLGVARIGHD